VSFLKLKKFEFAEALKVFRVATFRLFLSGIVLQAPGLCLAATTDMAATAHSPETADKAPMPMPLENPVPDRQRQLSTTKSDSPAQGATSVPAVAPDLADEGPKAPATEERRWIRASTANNIYFAYGSAELTDSALKWIAHHAERLLARPRMTVALIGYTDDFSSSSYSIALGDRRAQVVKEQLLSLNVSPSRICIISYGHEKFPTVPCQTEVCRASYRRVEFRYGLGDNAR